MKRVHIAYSCIFVKTKKQRKSFRDKFVANDIRNILTKTSTHQPHKLREKACQTHDVEGSLGAPPQIELVQHLLAAQRGRSHFSTETTDCRIRLFIQKTLKVSFSPGVLDSFLHKFHDTK